MSNSASYLFNAFGEAEDPGPLKLKERGALLRSSMPAHAEHVPELAFDNDKVCRLSAFFVVAALSRSFLLSLSLSLSLLLLLLSLLLVSC
jgi:hypothetical protein